MEKTAKIIEIKNPKTFLREDILTLHNYGFPESQWSMKKLDAFFVKENKGICFVVRINDNIKGLVIGKKTKNSKNSMNMSALFVSNELRGHGYAKKLVGMFIEKTVQDSDIKKIELHFRESNKLRDFYEKMGFDHCNIVGAYQNGELKHYMEISRDDIIM